MAIILRGVELWAFGIIQMLRFQNFEPVHGLVAENNINNNDTQI